MEELSSEDEITEGICTINDLGINFRHAHVELKSKFGERYENMYPNYDKALEDLNDFARNARHKIRCLRQHNEEIKTEKGKMVSVYENREKLKHEHELLNLKIDQFNSIIDVQSATDLGTINDCVSKMEGFINEYFSLGGKMKFFYEEEYGKLFEDQFKNRTNDMHGDIKLAKLLKKKLSEISEGQKESKEREKARACNLIAAQNLYDEINLRCDSLSIKFSVNLELLSDYQILEIGQNKELESEFNCILERISSLATYVLLGGEQVESMLTAASETRSKLTEKKKIFQQKLQLIIMERDVTPDKLKSGDFQIDLPKFSGYGGEIDFFTFKSQFQKIVEPKVQKKFWSDYLKRNYLSSPALVLVEKETDYLKIWEKLCESYSNTRLLQDKLGDLDKVGGLWKIKGKEKILNAIASLINCMKDLSFLANEHGIECQLYEGGGLQKVISLLGDPRHKRFRSQNLEQNISKMEEWGKLLDFLKQELQLRERLVLDHKTAKLMGFSMDKGENERNPRHNTLSTGTFGNKFKERYKAHLAAAHDTLKCHVCEKEGHVIITTKWGKSIIPYYVCEKFVNMSPSERFAKLKSKHLCTGCLYPGAFEGPKHKCLFTSYCCPHRSHENGKKIHILLCDTHKGDNKNLKLFEKFKEQFIKNSEVSMPECSKHFSYFSEMTGVTIPVVGTSGLSRVFQSEPEITECPIFQLQTIEVDGIKINLFFDSGCGDMIIKKTVLDKLKSARWAKQIIPGTMVITGVGDQKTECRWDV